MAAFLKMRTKVFPFLKGFREHFGAQGGFDLSLEEIPSGLKKVPGIYIIESSDKFSFPYPKGKSKVLYIGMTSNLDHRFREHRAVLDKLVLDREYGIKKRIVLSSRYQYMRRHGAIVYYYPCVRLQDPKNMESWALFEFYKQYRALPVGNGARSFEVSE